MLIAIIIDATEVLRHPVRWRGHQKKHSRGRECHRRQIGEHIEGNPKTNTSMRKADVDDYHTQVFRSTAPGDGAISIVSRHQDVMDGAQSTRKRDYWSQVSLELLCNAASHVKRHVWPALNTRGNKVRILHNLSSRPRWQAQRNIRTYLKVSGIFQQFPL
jgi:hypothetical protein